MWKIGEQLEIQMRVALDVNVSPVGRPALFLLALGFLQRLFRVFLHPEHDQPPDQVKRHGVVQGKLHGAFALLVLGQLLVKFGDAGRRGIKANMLLECRKMDKVSMQHKSRDAVADGFGGFGCGLLDGGPHLLQQRLDAFRESGDVGIDVFEIVHVLSMGYSACPNL